MAPPDVASRADDDGENDDAWRVGGFRVFGARTSPLRQKRGPLSVHDFLRASAAASDGATAPSGAASRTPLGKLFPGNAGLHRRAAAASRLRRSREDALPVRPDPTDDDEDVPARDDPSPSPTPSPTPAPVFDPAPRAGTARRLNLTPDASAFATPSPPRPPAVAPATFASAIDRALHRAREANGIHISHQPTVARGPDGDGQAARPSPSSARPTPYVDPRVDHPRVDHPRVDPARLARRRHRRRLAVIVVHQWKWFAADALESLPARMHREWRTRRETFRAWRRVASDRTTDAESAEKAEAFARAVARSRALAFLLLWESNARRSRLESTRLALAASHHRARRLARALPAWRDAMWSARRRRVRRARAEGFSRARALAGGFRAWRVATERRRVAARLAEALDAARDAALEARVLAEWRATIARERTRRAVAFARFRRAADAAATRASFLAWRRVSVDRRDARIKRKTAAAHRNRRVVANATRSWAAWAAYASDVRAKGDALASRFRLARSSRVLASWRVEALVVARLAKARAVNAIRTVADAWRRLAFVSARARAAAEARFASTRLRRVRDATIAWRETASRLAADRLATLRADAHARRLRVDTRFRDWVAHVATVRMTAAAVRFAAETTTRRCVVGWRARTEWKRRRDALRRVAARHSRDALRRFAFRGWRDVADVEWNRRERRHLAREHRRRARLSAAFERWSGPFLRRAADVDAAATKMTERRRRETRRATIRAWTVAAMDSKRRRRSFERAAAHAAAVVVHRATHAWRVATTEAKSRRAVEDAKVAAASSAMSRLRRDRIFDAWLERSRVGAIERVQVERAENAFHRRTRRRFVDAWTAFVAERRRSRAMATRADASRERALAYAGLEAFVSRVVWRRAKKVANDTARARFRTARTTACLSAWRRRVAEKRDAREQIAGAVESHRRWLLREGCAAWLREGLNRREWNAAEATRAAADAHAAALRRVEPYARRWRHRALGARASRRRLLGERVAGERLAGGVRPPSGPGPGPGPTGCALTLHREPSPEVTTLAESLGRRPAVRGAYAAESAAAFEARVERLCAPPPRRPRPQPRRPPKYPDEASDGGGGVGGGDGAGVGGGGVGVGVGANANATSVSGSTSFSTRDARLAPPPTAPTSPARAPSSPSLSLSRSPSTLSASVPVPPSVGSIPSSPRSTRVSTAGVAGSTLTPAKLREYESVIVEFEALRSEAARLRRDADALAPRDGASTDDAAAMAAAARRRVLAAAAAHLRRRRAELLPAVRAAAAALGEARDDLASVASGFSLS